MPFKDLEHEGDEDFDAFSVRRSVKKEKKEKIKQRKLTAEERLEDEQKEYMNINNPLLWDGDIDDD